MASTPPPSFPPIPPPADIVSTALDALPGESFILSLIGDIAQLPALIGGMISAVEGAHPVEWARTLLQDLDKLSGMFDRTGLGQFAIMVEHAGGDFSKAVPDDATFWNFVTKYSVGSFLRGMLHEGLGVDTQLFDEDAQRGLNTIDTMLGFAAVMPYLATAAEVVGKGLFGARFGTAVHESLGKLAEEMGLTWAMGMTIEESFKTAVGASLEEGINLQKRGSRLAWPQYKQMMKQHIFDTYKLDANGKIVANPGQPSTTNADAIMHRLLASSGFTDETIEWLLKLSDVAMPVGDIAQLYYREVIDEARVKELIGELGFNAEQTAWLAELYVTKAETQASVTYRSIAKNMYINHLISEDQYRTILTESNFPSRMIDQDIAGITLEQSTGHLLETVALVKSEYLHKQIDPSEATRRLGLLNYAPSYIAQLINSWDQPAIKAKHGLSTAKVLSYMISGLITPDQARPMLQSNGVDDTTVEFLLLHPTANTGAKQHALSPGLVTQAYMDGAISLSGLSDAYTRAGVAAANLDYYINIAKYKFSHKRGNAGYTQAVTAGEWRQAYKVGLIDFSTLVTELESVGYTPDGALLLAEIENKGPYQPPQPPAFATLQDALAYITAAGYVISPPTDPRLLAAENMAAVAGYTWQRSSTFPGIPGGGGVPPGGAFPPPATPPPTPPPGPGGPIP